MLDARVRATLDGYEGKLPDKGDTVVVIGTLIETADGPELEVASILIGGQPI